MHVNVEEVCEYFKSINFLAEPLSKKDCNIYDKMWRTTFLVDQRIFIKRPQQLSEILTDICDGALFLPDSEASYTYRATNNICSYIYASRGPAAESVLIEGAPLPTYEQVKAAPMTEDACIFPLSMQWSLLFLTEEWMTKKYACFIDSNIPLNCR